MENLVIRMLTADDVPNMRPIVDDDGMVYDPERITAFLSEKQNVAFTAIQDGVIIGLLYGYALTRLDSKPPQFFIYSVGVHSAHQNRGIGTRLVQHAVDWARNNGFSESFVPTEKDNPRACAVYEKAGMMKSGADCDRIYVIEY